MFKICKKKKHADNHAQMKLYNSQYVYPWKNTVFESFIIILTHPLLHIAYNYIYITILITGKKGVGNYLEMSKQLEIVDYV